MAGGGGGDGGDEGPGAGGEEGGGQTGSVLEGWPGGTGGEGFAVAVVVVG